jgi:PAS domain S-box-containing protein
MSQGQYTTIRYLGALAAVTIAGLAWWLFPAMQRNPFILFLAAVVIAARFLGFGPGILATIVSLGVIDYAVLAPPFVLSRTTTDLEQLSVFLVVSLLTAGLARQKSKADLRLDEVQRQMAAIVETSQEAILSKDVNGMITSWNAGAQNLYGYAPSEVVGRHVSIIAPPEKPDEIPGITHKLLQGERIQHYITERVRKDGTRVTVYLSVSPITNRKGEVIGASTIAHDMTAQRRAEEALRKNEKLATAGRLAATIAHEINNPLEVVGNLLYLARHDRPKSEQYLDMAEKELQRVGSIAQQTLGLVRDPASATAVDVGGVLNEVLNLYAKKLSIKKLQLQKLSEPGLEIRGFSGELRQLFSNLISNAIDATPEGGRLRLRVQRSHEWSDHLRPGIRVTVADSGSGITAQSARHIFEPFFTTKKDSGTGLGLWLSYSIVQKHGGSIRFRSRTTPGRSGTVFTVFLPEGVEPAKAPTDTSV